MGGNFFISNKNHAKVQFAISSLLALTIVPYLGFGFGMFTISVYTLMFLSMCKYASRYKTAPPFPNTSPDQPYGYVSYSCSPRWHGGLCNFLSNKKAYKMLAVLDALSPVNFAHGIARIFYGETPPFLATLSPVVPSRAFGINASAKKTRIEAVPSQSRTIISTVKPVDVEFEDNMTLDDNQNIKEQRKG
jgi:hypothetical protein